MGFIGRYLRRRRRRKRRSKLLAALLALNDVNNGPPGTLMFMGESTNLNANPYFPVRVYIALFRTNGDSGAVSATLTATDGTGINGIDYTITSPQTVSWADGEVGYKMVFLTLPLFPQEDKTFTLRLSNPTGGATIDPDYDEFAVTVQAHAGPAGQAGFLQSEYHFNENGTATIKVHRFSGTDGAVSVDYATEDGTAVAGTNYTSASGTLSWADGEGGSKDVVVTLGNIDGATPLTCLLRLSNPTNGMFIDPTFNPVTLNLYHVDPAAAGTLSHELTEVQVVESTTLTVTVKRLGGTAGAVGCSRATAAGTAAAGVNYTTTTGTLSWADGDGADKTFDITILTVNTGEFKRFTNTLSLATGGATLLDDGDVLTIGIYDNGLPPPAPITDTIVDDLYYSEDNSLIDDGQWMSREVHVIWANGSIDTGTIGFGGGTGSFGGGSDLSSADEGLYPSGILRFQVQEMVESEGS